MTGTIAIIVKSPPASDVEARLGPIATDMAALARDLEPLTRRPDVATENAAAIFDMTSPVSVDALFALSNMLKRAIPEQLAALPKNTRHETGDPMLVGLIDSAMRRNWPIGEPYPKKLLPRVSPTSAFFKIVDICFEAAGYPSHPKRSLEAYVKQWRKNGGDQAADPQPGAQEDLLADVRDAFHRYARFPRKPPKT